MAFVPVAGPVPPPIIVVIPEASAVSICWGHIKCIWVSIEPAVRIWPSPAITSVDAPITISILSGYQDCQPYQFQKSFHLLYLHQP